VRKCFEPLAELPLQFDLFPQARHMQADHLQRREAAPVQAVADFLQREAKLAQRQHLLQAGDIGACVEAVSRLGVQRRLQQANLVVMVQRADRKTRPPGQLTHLQGLKLNGDSPGRRPWQQGLRRHGTASRYVRVKGKVARKVDSRREVSCREKRIRSRAKGDKRTEVLGRGDSRCGHGQ
jgi:hypothetical protein